MIGQVACYILLPLMGQEKKSVTKLTGTNWNNKNSSQDSMKEEKQGHCISKNNKKQI